MNNEITFLITITLLTLSCSAQSKKEKYLFYLHGGVVQSQGLPAVSSYYGKYEYLAIIDSLDNYDFTIISEVRPKDTDDKAYGKKIANEVDSLLTLGVSPKNIVIVGASLGAYMTLEAALIIENPNIKYALLGLCSDYAVGHFTEYSQQLKGDFLSIFEKSDSKQSCQGIFESNSTDAQFEELELNLGVDHAFLFKPYDEWVIPLIKWASD